MAEFDQIAVNNGDREWFNWYKKAIGARFEIADFVAQRLGATVGGDPTFYRGSFNCCLRVKFEGGKPDAIIRFPKPGHTTFREEKIANEVEAIRILQEKTNIPVPRLLGWGSTKESPQELGPFIITEFASGVHLSDVLRDPTEPDAKRDYLDPNIDNQKLDFIYDQLADISLQMFDLNFNSIGSISKASTSNIWSVTGRPLTYSMNELATCAGYPVDQLPHRPFKGTSDYLTSLANEKLVHLRTQRNIAESPARAKAQYIARHLFAKLVRQYSVNDNGHFDNGHFKLFCDDFRPQNIFVDPDTLIITAVLDLEFTNAMPAQFAYEPPWWLLLVKPEIWVERGRTMDAFVAAYEPRLEQFLRAIERAEVRAATRGTPQNGRPLSALMRESWATGRFWFNYAARKPFDVDDLFYAHLNGSGAGIESLDDEERAGLEQFLQTKMEQLEAYKKEL